MKKLLVLGGTKISCQIVNQAKRMGLHTAVADYYEPDKSPAKTIADEHFLVSATDVNGIVDLIRRERMDGVLMGFADVLMPAYAAICEAAGLPSFCTCLQAERFTNKALYKSILRQYGVPTPASLVVSDASEVSGKTLPYPVIVKPADNSGARGCAICRDETELLAQLPNALTYSASRQAMIEEYMEGPEVTAFFLIQEGNVYFTALGNRHVENHQGDGVIPLPVGYSYPSGLTEYYSRQIAPRVAHMLQGEQIQNGMLFLQCIVKNGIPMVYDLGLRLTGSLEYHMLEAACGYNPLEMMIHFAVTGSMGPPISDKVDPWLHGMFGWNISALRQPGTVTALCGVEEIRNLADVVHVDVAHDPGDLLTEAEKGTLKQISCRFIGVSQSKPDMCHAGSRITHTFDVVDKMGNSLLLPQIDFARYLETM